MDDEQLLDFLLKEPVKVERVERKQEEEEGQQREKDLTPEQIKKRITHERTRNERKAKLKVKRREEMKELIDGLDDLILEDTGIVKTTGKDSGAIETTTKEYNEAQKDTKRRRERRKAKRRETRTVVSNIDVIDELRKEMYHNSCEYKPDRHQPLTKDSKMDRLQRLNQKLEQRIEKINHNHEKLHKNEPKKENFEPMAITPTKEHQHNDLKDSKTKKKRQRNRKPKDDNSELHHSEETHVNEKHSVSISKKREKKNDKLETPVPKIIESNVQENNDTDSKPKKTRTRRRNKKKDSVSTEDTKDSSKPATNKSRKRYENKLNWLSKKTDSQLFSVEY